MLFENQVNIFYPPRPPVPLPGIQITFPQPHFLTQERVLGYEKPYHVRWLGNTVVAMSGGGRRMDLYPELEN